MLIIDAHLDLAMNALEWNRDLSRPLEEIRSRDRHYDDKLDRGKGVVSFSEMRKAGIGLCVATQIARYVKPPSRLPGWHSPEQAWAQTQGQLAWYRAMEARGELVQIRGLAELDRHWALWANASDWSRLPIGYILTLEGADSILSPAHLERSVEQGLRAVGLSHYGPGTYAQGTNSTGGLGPNGPALLKAMERLGVILDVTHLSDESFDEALACFHGHVWASHCNCRSLVPHQRQLNDEQIRTLIARGAVIGVVLDAWMMVSGWFRGKTTPQEVGLKLERLVDHIDHICQLAGNARHVGIGSDLDGGFGREQCPADLESIADMARLHELLGRRGYSSSDIAGILHGNFLGFLQRAWSRPG